MPGRLDLIITETADLLGFTHTTISGVSIEWSEKEKVSTERQFPERNHIIC